MQYNIVLSADRILEQVYAFCALDHIINKGKRPAVLGRDNRKALVQLIKNLAAKLVYALGDRVKYTSLIDSPESDEIEVRLEIATAEAVMDVRPLLEAALADDVMATAYAGVDSCVSGTYDELYLANLEQVKARIRALDLPGRIEAA